MCMMVTHACLLQMHGQSSLGWKAASGVAKGTAAVAVCVGCPGAFSSISEILCGSSGGFGHADRPIF